MHIVLEINRGSFEVDVQPGERLLRVLRRLGFCSVKYGCDSGDCGACTILVDETPVLACLFPVLRATGRSITTAEALGHPDALHPLQQRFLEHGAVQCGYCTPAMLLVARKLLQENPHPDPEEIRVALAGVLCRCTGYVKPVEAICDHATRDATAMEESSP
jgi:aerobic-type carbon monoxide dehydrogenase small subunit (CoxS/CutS family)